jgi:predicted MFS family arabinose efflux permease
MNRSAGSRQLRAVVAARFVSLIGTNMTLVSLPWFVLATTGSTAKMGIVLACQTLPGVVAGVPGGTAVARLGPRRALIAADAVRAPLLIAVPVLFASGALPFAALLALVSLIGLFTVPYTAASSALLPGLVGEDAREVTRAQSALQVAAQVTGVLGPLAAGALVPLIGAPRLLYLDGASYAVSALIVALVLERTPAPSVPRKKQSLLVGARFMFGDPLLGAILSGALAAHVAFAALTASLPILAYREFHDARIAGTLFTAIAAGSIAGGLAALRLARKVPPLPLGCAGFALMAVPLWFLLVPRSAALIAAVAVVFGFGTQLGVSPITAVLTTQSPEPIRAQTVSAFLAISNAGVPAGLAVTGIAIASVGFGATYAAVAALMTAAAILLTVNVRRLDQRKADSTTAATIPAPADR